MSDPETYENVILEHHFSEIYDRLHEEHNVPSCRMPSVEHILSMVMSFVDSEKLNGWLHAYGQLHADSEGLEGDFAQGAEVVEFGAEDDLKHKAAFLKVVREEDKPKKKN